MHERLRLGVAQPDIEFEDFLGARRGHHQAGVEEAGELVALHRGEDDPVEDVAWSRASVRICESQ